MEDIYFKYKYTGEIWTQEEYDALMEREYEELWESLDEEEKVEFGTKDNYIKYMTENNDDPDFTPVDKDGVYYWHDEYFWNDED